MDPGVRQFQTLYDPHDGTHGVLLASYYQSKGKSEEVVPVAHELERRCRRIDRMVSRVRTKAVWEQYGLHPHGRQARRRWEMGTAFAGWYPGTTSSSESDRSMGGRRVCRRWLSRRVHQARRQSQRRLARERARLDGFKHSMHYAGINHLWRHWDLVIVSTSRQVLAKSACIRLRWRARCAAETDGRSGATRREPRTVGLITRFAQG